MSEAMSKARKIAEQSFERTQSQFLERTRAVRERDAEISEHVEKTRRLRIARLERAQSGKQPSSL